MKPFLRIGGAQSYDLGDNVFQVVTIMDVESDGTGPHADKRDAQNATTYQPSLNASVVPFVACPPQFRASQQTGVVIGCRVLVENLANGKSCEAVCADIEPSWKWGEASIECARRVGVPDSPVSGGTHVHQIRYTYFTSVAAVVDGKTYRLQPA